MRLLKLRVCRSKSQLTRTNGAHFWKLCAQHGEGEKLDMTEYELRTSTEISGATQTDGKDSDLNAVLGPKRTKRERVKLVVDLRFELHDRGLVCINETESRSERSWQLSEAVGGQFSLNASSMGRKRYVGFTAAKLRAIVITSFRAVQYTFNTYGDKHTGETPISAEMQNKLQDILQCGFAFTQSKAGHVMKFFHEESASKITEQCIQVKSSLAELFESYYMPNGREQYTINAIQSGLKQKLNVTTDHYYDGTLASVCTKTARGAREAFLKPGDSKVKSFNMRRGTSRCCTKYSMHGQLEQVDCDVKERESESGASTAKLTEVRRRRTRKVSKNQPGSKQLPNTVIPKQDKSIDNLVLLQDSADSTKFDWDAVWGQRSWTDSKTRDSEEKADAKVDFAKDVGGPFLGELGASQPDAKKKRSKTGEEYTPEFGAATISVMSGTTNYKLRQIKSVSVKTQVADTDLYSQSDVLLDLSSAWGDRNIKQTLPGNNVNSFSSGSQLVNEKDLHDEMMQLQTGNPDVIETLKAAFREKPSLALSASQMLLRGDCKDVAEDVIGLMAGAQTQDALTNLIHSPTFSAIAAAAAHQISQPEPQLLEALQQCSAPSLDQEFSHEQCTCMLALGHHAHRLHLQHAATTFKALAEHIWNAVSKQPNRCAMAALANSGPASSHKGIEVMKLATSHPDVSVRSMAMRALKESRHPGIDHFLQSRVGHEHPVVQCAAVDALGMRKSGSAAETAILELASRLKIGQVVPGSVKTTLGDSMSRRVKDFHSPAAEDLLAHLSSVQVLLQTDATKDNVFDMIREVNRTEAEASFEPTALIKDELEQDIQKKALETEVDHKYLAGQQEEISRKVKPRIVRAMKRKLKRELTKQVTTEHKVHVYLELKGRMKLKSRILTPKMKQDGFSPEKQAEVLAKISDGIKRKLMKNVRKAVRAEVKVAYRIREVEDLPGMIEQAVGSKVQKAMASKYSKATLQNEDLEIDTAENTQTPGASGAPTNKLSFSKCTDYDTTKKFSCERGEQSCFLVNGKATGCIGGAFFNTVDWSYIDGFRAEARGGFIADLYHWRGQLMDASTAGLYKGSLGKGFVEDTYLQYFDFETFSQVYLYRSTKTLSKFSAGDSCRGFQVPKLIKQVAARKEYFNQKQCYGLKSLGALCGTAILEGKIGADFGLNIVQPAVDAVTAYVRPHATISLLTSLQAEILGFELYAKGSTTVFSGENPVSSIFSISKFKGGYENRQALRFLSGSLKVGLKGPGMKRKTEDDIPKSISELQTNIPNASRIVSAMKREYNTQLGEGKLSFNAPICIACTNWAGPKLLSSIEGVTAVGVVANQDIPGSCGPNGRGNPVAMSELPRNSTESMAKEAETFDPSKVNPMLADSPEVAKKKLDRAKDAEAMVVKKVERALSWQVQAKDEWKVLRRKIKKASNFLEMSKKSLKVQKGRAKLATQKFEKDKKKGMGFLSMDEYNQENIRLKSSKLVVETARTNVQRAKVKTDIAYRNLKERSRKHTKATAKAKTADSHVKIANDAFVLSRTAEAALEGKSSSMFKKEVEASRRAVKEVTEKSIRDPEPLHDNINMANKLVMERREKVRKAQRQENQAVEEETAAGHILGQERIYKKGAKMQVVAERKEKGKGMVMEYIWHQKATTPPSQKLAQTSELKQKDSIDAPK